MLLTQALKSFWVARATVLQVVPVVDSCSTLTTIWRPKQDRVLVVDLEVCYVLLRPVQDLQQALLNCGIDLLARGW
jgi:hypothetical protein